MVSLAYQISKGPDVDWREVIALSKEARATRATLVGLCLVREHLGIDLPDVVQDEIRKDKSVGRLAEQSTRHHASNDARSITNAAFNVAIRESTGDRVRLLARLAGNATRGLSRKRAGGMLYSSAFRTLNNGLALAGTLGRKHERKPSREKTP